MGVPMMLAFGSGPVRGFAVTLAIGIVTTVFTAYTLTRWTVNEGSFTVRVNYSDHTMTIE